MRVALNGLFLNSATTGTGQYVRHLVDAVAPLAESAGIELCVISPLPDRTGAGNVCVARPLTSGNLAKVEFEHVTFPRACRTHHFNFAHVPHFGPPLYPSVPTVVTIHDLIPLVIPEYRGSLSVRLYTRLAAAGAARAEAVITDSEASRKDILARLPVAPNRLRVIYLAADGRFRPILDEAEIARVREKYHLPDKFILYLGGFDARKNLSVLIEAFEALGHQAKDGWKLVIAGRLPDRATAFFPDARTGAGPDVWFIGHVAEEDKPSVYSSAALFAFPSRYEGFGLPPLEAMACGTPVISANTGSLPEVVSDGGILINPLNVNEWTLGLRTLLNDGALRRELGGRALATSHKFSWDRTARETLSVYRSIASSGNEK